MNQDGRHGSDSSEEDSDERSPPRGRSGKMEEGAEEQDVDAQIEAMVDEHSKHSGV